MKDLSRGLRPGARRLAGRHREALLGVLAAVLWASLPAHRAFATGAPTPGALNLVRGLDATASGIDREGNLWAWDAETRQVSLYSPQGERLASAPIEFAYGIDADRAWGIAGIFAFGKELRLLSWDGQTRIKVPLADQAEGVAWIGPDTVAVSPTLAGHRVEIWNTRDRILTKKLGSEQPLTPKPGVTRLRTVALHYDPLRTLLYTLESFTGNLQIYSLDGKLVQQASVPSVRRPIDDSLAEQDREARARQDVQTPAIWWYRLAVSDSGTAWIVQSCDRDRGTATLFKAAPDGMASAIALPTSCCSLRHAVWGEWIVFFPSAPPAGSTCDPVRRLP